MDDVRLERFREFAVGKWLLWSIGRPGVWEQSTRIKGHITKVEGSVVGNGTAIWKIYTDQPMTEHDHGWSEPNDPVYWEVLPKANLPDRLETVSFEKHEMRLLRPDSYSPAHTFVRITNKEP